MFYLQKNGEYGHSIRAVLTVFHVRFVFVRFETFRFCKAVRFVFPDLHYYRVFLFLLVLRKRKREQTTKLSRIYYEEGI